MIIGIISPYSGDIEANRAYLRRIMAALLADGHSPVAGHAMYPGILDDSDPEQRKRGMAAGQQLFGVCDEIHAYCELGISKGMWEDIEFCFEENLPMHVCSVLGGQSMPASDLELLRQKSKTIGRSLKPILRPVSGD